MGDSCSRCASTKIIPRQPLHAYYGGAGLLKPIEIKIAGEPEAWLRKDVVGGQVSVDICGECGHADLSVSNFRDLYEKYQKAASLG